MFVDSIVVLFFSLFILLSLVIYICRDRVQKTDALLYFKFLFLGFLILTVPSSILLIIFDSLIKIKNLSIGYISDVYIELFLFSCSFNITSCVLFTKMLVVGWFFNKNITTHIPVDFINHKFIILTNICIVSVMLIVLSNTVYTFLIGFTFGWISLEFSHSHIDSKFLEANSEKINSFYKHAFNYLLILISIILVYNCFMTGIPLWEVYYWNYPFVGFNNPNYLTDRWTILI